MTYWLIGDEECNNPNLLSRPVRRACTTWRAHLCFNAPAMSPSRERGSSRRGLSEASKVAAPMRITSYRSACGNRLMAVVTRLCRCNAATPPSAWLRSAAPIVRSRRNRPVVALTDGGGYCEGYGDGCGRAARGVARGVAARRRRSAPLRPAGTATGTYGFPYPIPHKRTLRCQVFDLATALTRPVYFAYNSPKLLLSNVSHEVNARASRAAWCAPSLEREPQHVF
jgi:hypothetical protein